MINALTVMKARDVGEIRYSTVLDYSGDLNHVLAKFGLTADANLLEEFDRKTAVSILTRLLWKDMAYSRPAMSEVEANDMAESIVREYECPASKYFSNCDWSNETHAGFSTLTESTFDGGLIISRSDHRCFCIWFQDED